MAAIPNNVLAIRKAKGMVRAALAVQAECSPNTILITELHGHCPSEDRQARIARVLGAPLTDIWPQLVPTDADDTLPPLTWTPGVWWPSVPPKTNGHTGDPCETHAMTGVSTVQERRDDLDYYGLC